MAVYPDTIWTYRMALQSPDPLPALKDVVRKELDESGGDRQRVLNDLEEVRLVLREQGEDEDLVLDTMDFLTGWCSPHERI
jgi:hypothetical protein